MLLLLPIKIQYKSLRCVALVDYSLISREHRPRLTAGAFNKLGQYANSPGHRAYCCAELAVFFPSSSCNHNHR